MRPQVKVKRRGDDRKVFKQNARAERWANKMLRHCAASRWHAPHSVLVKRRGADWQVRLTLSPLTMYRHAPSQVKVKRRGYDRKFLARVLTVGIERDLVLLTVDHDAFWDASWRR